MQKKCSSTTRGECKPICYYSLRQCEKREGYAGCKSSTYHRTKTAQPRHLSPISQSSSSDAGLFLPPGGPTPDPFLLYLHFPTIAVQSHFRECQIYIIGPGMASGPQCLPDGSSSTSQRHLGCPRPMANFPAPAPVRLLSWEQQQHMGADKPEPE